MSNYTTDDLIKALDEHQETFNKVREITASLCAAPGTGVKPAPVRKDDVVDVDVSQIQFYTNDRAPAGEHAQWAWCYAYDQEGQYHPESKALLQVLERYGTVTQGRYEYRLSRDGKFLNRKLVKEGRESGD